MKRAWDGGNRADDTLSEKGIHVALCSLRVRKADVICCQ